MTTTLLENFGGVQTLTITNANLADSATAGWMSAAVDNSSNLYDDALVQVNLAAVNTAPANDLCVFLFAYALLDTAGSLYTSSGSGIPSGSEGTITFPSVDTLPIVMPLLGVIPYPVQNKAISSPPMSIAACFGGVLPPKWGICMINRSGMTLSVTSIQWNGVKYTNG